MLKKRLGGYTLVEVIVVIFIIGLVTSLILIRTGTIRFQRKINLFAETFFSFLQVCQQQAILQPAVIGVMLQDDTYQAYYWGDDAWVPLVRTDGFWAPTIIPNDIHIDIASNSKPQIVIDASGGMNAFELTISYYGEPASFRILSSAAGLLTLQKVQQ